MCQQVTPDGGGTYASVLEPAPVKPTAPLQSCFSVGDSGESTPETNAVNQTPSYYRTHDQ